VGALPVLVLTSNTGTQKVPLNKHSQIEGNFLTFAVDDSSRICLSLQKYEINIDV
jgi:hypothetical protein